MINRIKAYFRHFYDFSITEVRALMLLVPFTFFIIIFPTVYNHHFSRPHNDSSLQDSLLMADWQNSLQFDRKDKIVLPERRMFDPNKLTYEDWLAKGFNHKIATRIINYRGKGGVFRRKNDLFKIFGIDSSLVVYHLDFQIFPKQSKVFKSKKRKSWKKSAPKILVKTDLNKAEDKDLQSIRGIGIKLSSRIVRFRDALGGFVSVDQLHEVYGLDSALVSKIEDAYEIKSAIDPPLNINSMTSQELAKHPYLTSQHAKSIVKYREQNGDFRQIDDLSKIVSLPDSVIRKVEIYTTTTL